MQEETRSISDQKQIIQILFSAIVGSIDILAWAQTYTELTKYKVVWSEDLTKWSRSHRVHRTRLQIHQDGTWNIFSTWKNKIPTWKQHKHDFPAFRWEGKSALYVRQKKKHFKGIGSLTWGFVVININPVQLKVTVTMVTACWVNSMLVTNDFPELE